MAKYSHIRSLKPQPSDNDNRILIAWIGPDEIAREYAVNQRTLKRFNSEAELKAALDDWTTKNFGYTLDDVWFHLNDDSTWAIATGANPPPIWPEDQAAP